MQNEIGYIQRTMPPYRLHSHTVGTRHFRETPNFSNVFLTPLYTPFTSSELINSLLFVLLTCYICTHIHDVVFQVETQNLIITFHDLFTSPHMIGSRLQ